MAVSLTKEKIETIKKEVDAYKYAPPDDLFFCIEDIQQYVEPDLKKNIPFLLWLQRRQPKSSYEQKTMDYIDFLIKSESGQLDEEE